MERKRPDLRDPRKPRFPVIYKEPTFEQVRDNMSQADYIQGAIIGLVSFPLGYIMARQLDTKLARPGMWFTGIIGALGGAMLAHQNSSLRLQGFGRNDDEVARYQSVNQQDTCRVQITPDVAILEAMRLKLAAEPYNY